MGTYSTASSTKKFFFINQAKPLVHIKTDLLVVINEGPAVKISTRFWEEEHRDAHCIIGARLNNRTVPNLPNVVLLPSIRGLFEVVMQRRVEDAEL